MNGPVDLVRQVISSKYLAYLVIGMLVLLLFKLPLSLALDQKPSYYPPKGTVSFVKSDLSLEEIGHQPELFQPLNETASFGYGAATYWLNLDLQNLDPATGHVLKISFPILNRATLYYQELGVWQSHQAGIDIPHRQWRVEDRNIVFPLAAGTEQVYLRLETKHTLLAPIELIPLSVFHEIEIVNSLVWGSFYGLVLIMIIYNGLLYISTRQESYLYYVGYVVSTTLFVSSLNGIGYQYIWPGAPSFNAESGTIFPCLMMLFSVRFTQLFLELKTHFRAWYQALSVILTLNLALLICAAFVATDLNLLTSLLVDVSVITVLSAGLYSLRKRQNSARYFVVGWSAFLIGVGIYACTTLGVLPTNSFTLHAKEVGFVVEIMLLSFALADRIRSLTINSIHANRERENALTMANRALQDSMQVKDDFLATISHELRTPINGFIGALEVLHDTKPTRQQAETIDVAYDSALKMYSLVESMLEFNELQNDSLKLIHKEFALTPSLHHLSKHYELFAKDRSFEFSYEIARECPEHALGDGYRLLQIIDQLLNNAFKFTSTGSVHLSIHSQPTSENELILAATVTDTGVGIPTGAEVKLFQPFMQVDSSTTRNFQGLGLGLSLMDQLATKMGGAISYAPNQIDGERSGSVFTLSLPLSLATCGESLTIDLSKKLKINRFSSHQLDEHESDTNAPSTRALGKSASRSLLKTILIVEDNPTNLLVATKYCEKLGFNVMQAENGQLAVDLLENNTVDAIIMDCQMPILDGFEATRKIRALSGEKGRIPIVAVTANTSAKDYQHCFEVGMDDFLAKPITKAMIAEKLEHWLSQDRQDSQVYSA